jgi:hypothetical protein
MAMAVACLSTLVAVACLAQEGNGRGKGAAAADPERFPAYDSAFWEHWGDGRAELAGYDLVTPRYGAERQGTAVAMFVTEPFSAGARVKADGPAREDGEGGGTFQAMKLNLIQDVPTGVYDYNLMTSAFVALQSVPGEPALPPGAPVKVSFSSQEWCGHVYPQALFRQSGVRLRAVWPVRSHAHRLLVGCGAPTLRVFSTGPDGRKAQRPGRQRSARGNTR